MTDRYDEEAKGVRRRTVLCDTCERRTAWNICEAFPEGIPWDILQNRWDHREHYPGPPDDHGLTFKSKPWTD